VHKEFPSMKAAAKELKDGNIEPIKRSLGIAVDHKENGVPVYRAKAKTPQLGYY